LLKQFGIFLWKVLKKIWALFKNQGIEKNRKLEAQRYDIEKRIKRHEEIFRKKN